MATVVWHGTKVEWQALQEAVSRSCECVIDQDGQQSECASHHATRWNQEWVDRLLFARRIAARLLQEEGLTR